MIMEAGMALCLDFNREIHWIERADRKVAENSTRPTERLVLKIHYAEAPRIIAPILPAVVLMNTAYNRFARFLFLTSLTPEKSASYIAHWVGWLVNGLTAAGGGTGTYFGTVAH